MANNRGHHITAPGPCLDHLNRLRSKFTISSCLRISLNNWIYLSSDQIRGYGTALQKAIRRLRMTCQWMLSHSFSPKQEKMVTKNCFVVLFHGPITARITVRGRSRGFCFWEPVSVSNALEVLLGRFYIQTKPRAFGSLYFHLDLHTPNFSQNFLDFHRLDRPMGKRKFPQFLSDRGMLFPSFAFSTARNGCCAATARPCVPNL